MIPTEYVFLHAGGCLIETPQLTIPGSAPPAVWRWVATLWRDSDQPDGWRALVWEAADRGWWLPTAIMRGDVVEFGVSTLGDDGEQRVVTRWWGWVESLTYQGLVVVGPFDHPMRAVEAARPTVDELRLAQLAAPRTFAELAGHSEVDN